MKLSCIALPDKTSSIKIRAIMELLSNESKSKKALAFPPHFTLWGDFKINDDDLSSLTKDIQLVANRYIPLTVDAGEYGFYPWRIIYLDVKESGYLHALHNSIMGIIQRHRLTWVPKVLAESTHYSTEQKESINKYGYQFAGKFFSPHFTLAGNDMTQEDFDSLSDLLSRKHEDIHPTIEKVALVQRDNNSNEILWLSS